MSSYFKLLVVPLLLAVAIAACADTAEAKRFGGGRSFGGSKSFKKNYSKPISPQKQAAKPGQAAGATTARRGLFGGMGGMFGGLLAGTLLGSLLFGGGFAGGGLMDILLIGGLIYLVMKLFKRRRPATQYAGMGGGSSHGGAGPQPGPQAHMRDAGGSGWSTLGGHAQGSADYEPEVSLPDGFDADDFLEGAKVAFGRLQASWDKRDLHDIRQFTSDAVFEEISEQVAEDPGPSKTEVLMLTGRLLEAKEDGGVTRATVFFDAMIREDASAQQAGQVREVWHFKSQAGGSWVLDGIQQLES